MNFDWYLDHNMRLRNERQKMRRLRKLEFLFDEVFNTFPRFHLNSCLKFTSSGEAESAPSFKEGRCSWIYLFLIIIFPVPQSQQCCHGAVLGRGAKSSIGILQMPNENLYMSAMILLQGIPLAQLPISVLHNYMSNFVVKLIGELVLY